MFVEDRTKFTLVVVQLSSLCNLNCSYCYVPDRKNNQLMSQAVWSRLLDITVGDQSHAQHTFDFLFHAGEPLAIGLEAFKRYIDQVIDCAVPGVKYSFSVQTNGTLINQKWATFLREYDFSVGISIDGPAHVNDVVRVNWNNKGTLAKSLDGINELKIAGHKNFGCLAVVGENSLRNPLELIEFFHKEIGISSVGFNIEDIDGINTKTSFGEDRESNRKAIRRELVEPFYNEIFDYWWPVRDQLSIREFSDVLRTASRIKKNPDYKRVPDIARPLGIITVGRDGSITTFAPEFASAFQDELDIFVIGNVLEIDSLKSLEKSPKFLNLVSEVMKGVSACEKECDYYSLCGSSHVSNRYFEYKDFSRPDTFTCEMMVQAAADVCFRKIGEMTDSDFL